MVFADRDDAGRRLAARLGHLRGKPGVVLGLPRGGVPVAFQVARALSAPLDVIVVRKLGVPFQPELAMGAVGEGRARVINQEIVREARVSDDELAAVQRREQAEVEARAARYRAWWPRQPLDGRVAVVVDDGIATGSTARGSAGTPTSWSASARRCDSSPSASFTSASLRYPMTRSAPACGAPYQPRRAHRRPRITLTRPSVTRKCGPKPASSGWPAT